MNTQDQAKSHTVAELLAMDDLALNAMAAELRGIRRAVGGGGWIEDSTDDFYDAFFLPATDRNQSGELLDYAGNTFPVWFGVAHGETDKVVRTYFDDEQGVTIRETAIPGNDARAETVAFCAAMLAMERRLI